MLEELGLGEAASAADADVVVFNTCTIREKPDTKLAAYLGEAAARKREDPGRVIAVGGCYAEAQRERIFERYPDVDVAFGPGSIAHLADWLGAGGVGVARGRFGLDERAFAATLPMHRERSFQAWVQVSMGCNSTCSYCIVPAVRGREQSRRPGDVIAEVTGLAAEGVKEVTLLGQNVNSWGRDLAARHPHRVRRAAARLRCGRGHRADPVHEPAPEGLPRAGDRRDRRVRRGLRARPSAAAVRLVADPEGDATHVHARALPRARRTHAGGDAGRRARHRHHRRLPRRDRRRLRADARGGRGSRLRQRVHLRLLAAPGHRRGRDGRPGAARAEDRAHGAAGRRRRSGSRASATPPGSAASSRCSSRAARAPTRRSCAAGHGATRR